MDNTDRELTPGEKEQIIKEFTDNMDPYSIHKVKYDMRGLSEYVEQNHMSWSEITPEVMLKFRIAPKKYK